MGVMLPFFDLLNHEDGTDIDWSVGDGSGDGRGNGSGDGEGGDGSGDGSNNGSGGGSSGGNGGEEKGLGAEGAVNPLSNGDGFVTFRCGKAVIGGIKAGDECFNNYGAKSNEELLM